MQSGLIAGGAGFIGQNLVHAWRTARPADYLTVPDAITCAANIRSLEPLIVDRSIQFEKGDVGDAALPHRLFEEHRIIRVAHLTAESHVERSITDAEAFLRTTLLDTFTMLRAALDHRRAASALGSAPHGSTDEVDGSLCPTDPAFTESSPYRPNSPYAASNAPIDHLVRALVATYGMPALIINCSNNCRSYQLPEKLIPLIIHALEGKPLPVNSYGSNLLDWLHVSDHCDASGGNKCNNRDAVGLICGTIDLALEADFSLAARFPSCLDALGNCRMLMTYADRPKHDDRDATRLSTEVGSDCSVGFKDGLSQIGHQYLTHKAWWRDAISGNRQAWIDKYYGFRIAVWSLMGIQLYRVSG